VFGACDLKSPGCGVSRLVGTELETDARAHPFERRFWMGTSYVSEFSAFRNTALSISTG
jgi:hypothetical protein